MIQFFTEESEQSLGRRGRFQGRIKGRKAKKFSMASGVGLCFDKWSERFNDSHSDYIAEEVLEIELTFYGRDPVGERIAS